MRLPPMHLQSRPGVGNRRKRRLENLNGDSLPVRCYCSAYVFSSRVRRAGGDAIVML